MNATSEEPPWEGQGGEEKAARDIDPHSCAHHRVAQQHETYRVPMFKNIVKETNFYAIAC